jgi:hypothetical protein
MQTHIKNDTRRRGWRAIRAAAWLGALMVALPGPAAEIVRVEEQWELKIATPDPASDAPQVICLVSPLNDIRGVHAAFELNQRSQPYFSPGGLQLQLWDGESPLGHVNATAVGVLGQPEETVTWTQVMEVSAGVLRFSIAGGQSTTWGGFGGDGLSIAVPTTLANLNQYDPAVSVRNSAVGYAANRVHSLTLTHVRKVDSTGEATDDDTVRVVHALP